MKRIRFHFSIPKPLRSFATTKLLNWAENKPPSTNGILNELQNQKKFALEEADRTFLESRSPVGHEIELLTFRMFEIYQLEQQDNLRKKLEGIFTNNQFFKSRFFDQFDKFSNSISSGGWHDLGILYRESRPLGGLNNYCMSNLPKEVNTIHLGLFKALPSLMVITFDIQLNIEVKKEIERLSNAKYLPEIEIDSIYPFDDFVSISSGSSLKKMQDTLLEYIQKIQKEIVTCLQPIFCGEYMKYSKNKVKLPVIEVFVLTNNTKKKIKLSDISKKSKFWFESYGFYPYWGQFINNDFAYSEKSRLFTDGNETPSRILIFKEKYLQTIDIGMYGNIEGTAIAYTLKHSFLDYFIIPFAITEYLQLSLSNIEQNRKLIYKSINNGKIEKPNLKQQLSRFNDFSNLTMSIERFIFEFDQEKSYIIRQFEKCNPNDLIFTTSGKNKLEQKISLFTNTKDQISELTNTLKGHIHFIGSSYSKFIDTKNISVMYLLQNVMLWVSLIAIFVSVISIIANWIEIWAFIKLFIII